MIALLRYAQEVGYTMFDAAPACGDLNGEYLGEAVRPFRDKVVIAMKLGILHMQDAGAGGEMSSSRESVLRQTDKSLILFSN